MAAGVVAYASDAQADQGGGYVIKVLDKARKRLLRSWWASRLESCVEANGSELVKLGTAHGGWTVPKSAVEAGGTAVCVGAGEDISFDVELNKKGFRVFTVDPTPRAKEHVANVLAAAAGGPPASINNSRVEFYDLHGFDSGRYALLDSGVWNENTVMRFFAPKDPTHVSHSIVNLQGTDEWFEARCETLKTICDSNQIGEINILKLDIEGSEYAVVANIIESGLRPPVLCVEFDEIRNPLDGKLMNRIRSTIKLLGNAGYKFRHLENSNALFVR
jgi:FkbM family methyltransferase